MTTLASLTLEVNTSQADKALNDFDIRLNATAVNAEAQAKRISDILGKAGAGAGNRYASEELALEKLAAVRQQTEDRHKLAIEKTAAVQAQSSVKQQLDAARLDDAQTRYANNRLREADRVQRALEKQQQASNIFKTAGVSDPRDM